jgi:hypothetical protein
MSKNTGLLLNHFLSSTRLDMHTELHCVDDDKSPRTCLRWLVILTSGCTETKPTLSLLGIALSTCH